MDSPFKSAKFLVAKSAKTTFQFKMSVCQQRLGGNVIFLVKIPPIKEHLFDSIKYIYFACKSRQLCSMAVFYHANF